MCINDEVTCIYKNMTKKRKNKKKNVYKKFILFCGKKVKTF